MLSNYALILKVKLWLKKNQIQKYQVLNSGQTPFWCSQRCISAHPAQEGDIFKYMYMYNIRLGAERTPGLGFKAYDEQFRLKRAMDQSKSFGKIDDELWLIYMANTTCQSLNPITNNTRSQKCFNFNYRGVCKRPICKYQHTCMQCGLPHPVASHHNVALGTHDENLSTYQQNF